MSDQQNIERLDEENRWLRETLHVVSKDHWKLLQENERLKRSVKTLSKWSDDYQEALRGGHEAMLNQAMRACNMEYWTGRSDEYRSQVGD